MAMDIAQHLLSVNPSHWTIIANNKRVFCSEIHSKHVNQLFHHLTAAVELEQHLLPGDDDNGWIHHVDNMQLAQKFSSLRMSQLKMHHVSLEFCSKISGNVLVMAKKNNVAKSIGGKCLCNCVHQSPPPDSLVLLLQDNNKMTHRHSQFMKSDPNKNHHFQC